MPLYIADYLVKTSHLGALQSGAYLHLIMHYWQSGCVPDNDTALMRVARMTAPEWKRNKSVIQAFFYDGWRHKRIDDELAHAADVSSKRRASAEQGLSKRAAKAMQLHSNSTANDAVHARGLSQPQSQRKEEQESRKREFVEVFWNRWPNRVGKKVALAAFVKARAAVSLETIMAGVDRYISNRRPDQFWQNPATFLNGESWNDQPAALNSAKTETPANPVVWVTEDDPRWVIFEQRMLAIDGKKPKAAGSRHESGFGFNFPAEWIEK
jgi:uncharacterized protein YdaU (DUF1376 family)